MVYVVLVIILGFYHYETVVGGRVLRVVECLN